MVTHSHVQVGPEDSSVFLIQLAARLQITLVTYSVIVTQRGGGGEVKVMMLIDTDHLFSAGNKSFTANAF